MHRNVALATTVAVALAAGGCGGSGSTHTESARLGKSQLVSKVNAVCAKFNRQTEVAMAALGKTTRGSASKDAFERVVASVVRYRTDAADELGRITPPDALQPSYSQFTADFRKGTALMPTGAQLQTGHDPNAGARTALNDRMSGLAKRIGFRVCY